MASRLYAEICCKITFCKQRGREREDGIQETTKSLRWVQ
jgi:hypothetical protein